MWIVDPVYAYDYTREAERYLKFCARLKKFEIKARLRFDMNLIYLTSFVYFDEDEGLLAPFVLYFLKHARKNALHSALKE